MDADDLFSTSNMNAYDLDSSTMNQSYYPVNIKPASLRQDRAGQRTLFQQLEITKENGETFYIVRDGV